MPLRAFWRRWSATLVVGLLLGAQAFALDVQDSEFNTAGGYSSSSSFQMESSINFSGNAVGTTTTFREHVGTAYYPSATSPVVSVTAGENSLDVSWTASTATFAGVDSYEVGIATSASGTYTYTSNALLRTKTFTGLTGGTTYYVKVRVYDGTLLLATSAAVSGTPTGSDDTPPGDDSGGGGGGGSAGGGGGGSIGGYRSDDSNGSGGSNTRITIEGTAYPWSVVTILQNGVVLVTTVAGPDAHFSVSVQPESGNYTYSVYTTDNTGLKSDSYTFRIGLEENTSTSVGGIFIPPTVSVQKPKVEFGDSVPVLGQAAPESAVDIVVHSDPFIVQTQASKGGSYFYRLDTAKMEIGQHTVQAKATLGVEISDLSRPVSFQIVNPGELTDDDSSGDCGRADLNCDGRVNLVDFSIAAYWYERPLEGAILELERTRLSGDGAIDLVDMSILAYYWTA